MIKIKISNNLTDASRWHVKSLANKTKRHLQHHALTPSNHNKDIMKMFPNIVPIDQFTGLYFSHSWSVRTLQKPGWCFITFREFSKIISRKYTMPAITLMVKISSGDFAHVSKALLWAHVQSFSLKPSWEVRFLQYTNFERKSWWARETLVKQACVPGTTTVVDKRCNTQTRNSQSIKPPEN